MIGLSGDVNKLDLVRFIGLTDFKLATSVWQIIASF
jgi:hypothetical protein